jgi:hypothetical protein
MLVQFSRIGLLLSGVALFGSAGAAPPVPDQVRQYHFAVSLDGKPIGEHTFSVSARADAIEVTTQARFKVKILLVPVYHYEHDDKELWHDGCLAKMDAKTNDNGTDLAVHGERTGEHFQVHGPKDAAELPACVKSFAYWDQTFLTEHRLLNAQTGEYEPITISDLGADRVKKAGRQTDAHHYKLIAKNFKIDLWYSPSGEWLALESEDPKGRKLHYEIQ